MLIDGSFNTSLLAMLRSNDNNSDGNNNKFESIAKSNVAETSPPKATVPPKLEIINTENPKKINSFAFSLDLNVATVTAEVKDIVSNAMIKLQKSEENLGKT